MTGKLNIKRVRTDKLPVLCRRENCGVITKKMAHCTGSSASVDMRAWTSVKIMQPMISVSWVLMKAEVWILRCMVI